MTAGQVGGFWDDKQCTEKFNFICEKLRPDITPPTKAPTPPPAQGCADGWTALPHFRNCYKVNDSKMDEMKTMGFSTPVNRPVLDYLPIHSSSSTMWTGPRRRAGEQPMRTALQEELIWLASTVRRRRSSCLSTAKPAASGSASSTIPQREVSRAREQ